MRLVEVWLENTSEPIVHDTITTYVKGPFYCVYCVDNKVVKYPVDHIFRIVEGYVTHAGNSLKKE